MTTGLAPFLRGHDQAALRQRVGVVACGVARASDEPFPVVAVADRELPGSAFLAATDEILLADRWAIGRDAVCRRAAAIRVLDHRGTALRAVLCRSLDDPHLWQWMRVSAGGVAIASKET